MTVQVSGAIMSEYESLVRMRIGRVCTSEVVEIQETYLVMLSRSAARAQTLSEDRRMLPSPYVTITCVFSTVLSNASRAPKASVGFGNSGRQFSSHWCASEARKSPEKSNWLKGRLPLGSRMRWCKLRVLIEHVILLQVLGAFLGTTYADRTPDVPSLTCMQITTRSIESWHLQSHTHIRYMQWGQTFRTLCELPCIAHSRAQQAFRTCCHFWKLP
jgi:hypothetical protein